MSPSLRQLSSRVRFAPVFTAPTLEAIMYSYAEQPGTLAEIVGNYHLLIASEVLRDEDRWTTLFGGTLAGPDTFIIVDNGVIEEGRALDPGELVRAANAVGAQALVVPDVIDDRVATLKLAAKTIKQLDVKRPIFHVGVAQGVTVEEAVECGVMLSMMGCNMLAVPRGLTKNLGSRRKVVELLHAETKLPIHLLGWSNNLFDDINCTGLPGVIGMDCATPVWLGMFGKPLMDFSSLSILAPQFANGQDADSLPTVYDPGPRPKGFWDIRSFSPGEIFQIASNILKVREWVSQAAAPTAPTTAKR